MLEGLCSIESVFVSWLYFYHGIKMDKAKSSMSCSCCLHIYITEEREIFKTTSLRFFDFHIPFLLVGKKRRERMKSNLISNLQKNTFPRDLEELKRRNRKNKLFRGEKNKQERKKVKIPRNNNRGRSFSKVPGLMICRDMIVP